MGGKTTVNCDAATIAVRRRLIEKVEFDPATGCWVWTGCRKKCRTDTRPWMHAGPAGRKDFAYRVAYRCFIGPIPPGQTVDHLCRNPLCCNPRHLEAKPFSENRSAVQRDYGRRCEPEAAACGLPF